MGMSLKNSLKLRNALPPAKAGGLVKLEKGFSQISCVFG